MKIIKRFKKGMFLAISAPKNIFFRRTSRPLYPEFMVFEITSLCNSRCTHCSIWKHPGNIKEEITRKEIKKALQDKVFKKLKFVLITGGEALLKKDLKEIIHDMNEIFPGIHIYLSTNGLLPDKAIDLIKFSKEKGINIGIGISLDALGEKHDLIRGVPGNFKKIEYLLKELVKIREKYGCDMPIGLGFTLSKYTAKDYIAVKKYAEKFDVGFLSQTYNEAEYYKNDLKEKDKKIDSQGNEELINVINQLPASLLKKLSIKSLKGENMKFSCYALQKFFLLRPNGDVAPCLNWCNSTIGNIKYNSPSEVWKSKKAKEVRKKILKCGGCLNDWCTNKSFEASFYPMIPYYLRKLIQK